MVRLPLSPACGRKERASRDRILFARRHHVGKPRSGQFTQPVAIAFLDAVGEGRHQQGTKPTGSRREQDEKPAGLQ